MPRCFPRVTQVALFTSSLLAIGLTGCGGGGGEGGSSAVRAITGTVIDGYIRGAKVCVDINGNLKCDPNEPTAESGIGGSYSINAGFDVSGYNVIAEVGTNAVDEEEGPVTSPFSLAAPADSPSVQVTPLTTLISMEVISSKDASATFSQKLAQAKDAIALVTGIPREVLSSDFTKSPGTSDAKNIARVVAVAIQEHKKEVNSGLAPSELEDAKAASFKAAVETVRQNVIPNVVNEGKLTGSLESVISTVTNDVKSIAQGKVAVIVANSKLDTPTVANLRDILRGGLFIAQQDSGRYRNAQGDCVIYNIEMTVAFASGSPERIQQVESALINGQWLSVCDDDSLDYLWTGTAWVRTFNGPPTGGTLTSQNCATFPQGNSQSPTVTVCFVQRDFSRKKITDIFPEACRDLGDAQKSACNAATFAEGSIGFDLTQSISADSLQLWAGDVGRPSNPISSGSLRQFIQNAHANQSTLNEFKNVYARIASLDSEVAPTKGELIWSRNSNDFAGGQTSKFEIRSVRGKEAMIINLPPIYRQANEDDADHQGRIFVRIETGEISGLAAGIYTGQIDFSAIKRQLDFVNSRESKFGSIELLNSYTDAVGLPRFPK